MGVIPILDTEADVVVSQSDYKSLLLCGQRVAQRDEPGFVDVPSEAMSWGSLLHAMDEATLLGEDPARLQVRTYVADLWEHELAKEGYALGRLASLQVINAGVAEAMAAHRLWVEAFYSTLDLSTVLAVEDRRSKRLEGPNGEKIAIEGTADLVVSGPRLYDWKSSGQAKGWGVGRELTEPQAPVYVGLYDDLYDIDEQVGGIPFTWWIWERKNYKWDVRTLMITRKAVDATMEALKQAALAKYYGILPPNPYGESYGKSRRGWHCSAKYCGAWDICPFKAMVPDDVDLSERVNPQAGWVK